LPCVETNAKRFVELRLTVAPANYWSRFLSRNVIAPLNPGVQYFNRKRTKPRIPWLIVPQGLLKSPVPLPAPGADSLAHVPTDYLPGRMAAWKTVGLIEKSFGDDTKCRGLLLSTVSGHQALHTTAKN
jgi:hypothetical protein